LDQDGRNIGGSVEHLKRVNKVLERAVFPTLEKNNNNNNNKKNSNTGAPLFYLIKC